MTSDPDAYSAMPVVCSEADEQHREELQMTGSPLLTLVARLVGNNEMMQNEKARVAMMKDWVTLHGKMLEFFGRHETNRTLSEMPRANQFKFSFAEYMLFATKRTNIFKKISQNTMIVMHSLGR
jgi:hypothetical protein